MLVVPAPGFRVDGLAHGTQQTQGRQIILFHPFLTLGHEGPDGRGCRIELVDLPLVHGGPEPTRIRIGGHPFEHETGGALGQRAVHDIGVSGDPADVRRAPIDVAVMVIKDILKVVAV